MGKNRNDNVAADIDSRLYDWWQGHHVQAEELAEIIVDSVVTDTFVDEVMLENKAIIVRALRIGDLSDYAESIETVLIDRLRKIFGGKAKLELTEVTQRFGDDV